MSSLRDKAAGEPLLWILYSCAPRFPVGAWLTRCGNARFFLFRVAQFAGQFFIGGPGSGGKVLELTVEAGELLSEGGEFGFVRLKVGGDANVLALELSEFAGDREQASAQGIETDDFRAVAPPVMSFASGRRR